MKQINICGESGDVQGATVDSCMEGETSRDSPRIYKRRYLECVYFGVLYPIVDLGKGGGGKQTKVTVALFVSASCSKEKSDMEVRESEMLKQFDKSVLPVTYFSQK